MLAKLPQMTIPVIIHSLKLGNIIIKFYLIGVRTGVLAAGDWRRYH